MFNNSGNSSNPISNGIGELLKGLDFKNLNFLGIADKLVHLVPDGKGKQAMDLTMNLAKNGGSPQDIKRALENMIPGSKEKIASVGLLKQVWDNIPDDKDAVVTYGQNVMKQLQFLKK